METVEKDWTGVRFHFNKTGPYSPVFLSLENEDRKKDRTIWSGPLGPQSGPFLEILGLDCTVQSKTGLYIYIYIIHSYRILSVIVLLNLTPNSTWLRSKSHFRRILGVIALLPKCWIRSVANGGIVITIVTIESWGGLV